VTTPASRLARRLHPKHLGNTLGAIAGLASALSVGLGFLAARASPHGFARLTIALHLAKEPLIVKLAAGVAGIAVATAALAGVLKFYTWWTEHEADLEAQAQPPAARDNVSE